MRPRPPDDFMHGIPHSSVLFPHSNNESTAREPAAKLGHIVHSVERLEMKPRAPAQPHQGTSPIRYPKLDVLWRLAKFEGTVNKWRRAQIDISGVAKA